MIAVEKKSNNDGFPMLTVKVLIDRAGVESIDVVNLEPNARQGIVWDRNKALSPLTPTDPMEVIRHYESDLPGLTTEVEEALA